MYAYVLNDAVRTIVGVMPPGTELMFGAADVWVPLRLEAPESERSHGRFGAIGKISRGVSIDEAEVELDGNRETFQRLVQQVGRQAVARHRNVEVVTKRTGTAWNHADSGARSNFYSAAGLKKL